MKGIVVWLILFLMMGVTRVGALAQTGSSAGDRDASQTDNTDSLIEETRRHARGFMAELPNFVVNQRITCHARNPLTEGKWKTQSTLDIEMTFELPRGPIGQREFNYAQLTGESKRLVKVDGKPTTKSYKDLQVMTSAGEFGAALMIPFGSAAVFKEVKHDLFRGRDTVIYDFKAKRQSLVVNAKRTGIEAGAQSSSGKIWIDPDTERVMRIESYQEGMPPERGLTLWEIIVDYDWITIEDHKYLLPVHAEVLVGFEAQKVYAWNVIEFANYHRWEGKIKIVPDPK